LTAIPVFGGREVEQALPPAEAVDVVRDAFVAHARGEWTMPPKLYVTNYPAGDFRAMPALGGGHALLKWVTSFPGNPARGLPTVSGAVLLSNAATGELEAILDAAALTALRTGAAAVLAAETLASDDSSPASVIGAGINGRAVARTFAARGRDVAIWDIDGERARTVASELDARVIDSREQALAAAVVVTVTPGRSVIFSEGTLQAGQHVSLMGADGPGKSEIAPSELARSHVFCDEWEQASHGGDIARALAAGSIGRQQVTQLGDVLTGTASGRGSQGEITVFDSTGLAIQDLAVAIACLERVGELDPPTIEL
jgi:alanine dehydrogenase